MPALDRPVALSAEVCRLLLERIRSGELAPGARLPTEKSLGDALGVSRAVVREALSRLKADGMVESRQGSGAFVAARPGSRSFRLAEDKAGNRHGDLAQVFELRMMVEVAAAELAAKRRRRADLAHMRAALRDMDAALERRGDGADADDRFHRAIADATRNPMVARFVEFLGGNLSESRVPTWSEQGFATGLARAAQEEHHRLYAAIEAGDARAARRHAQVHLNRAAARLGLAMEEG